MIDPGCNVLARRFTTDNRNSLSIEIMTTPSTKDQKAANLRTGLALGSVALFFFIAVIIKHLFKL